MEKWNLPDLTFPNVSLGMKETPWDLCPLLFRGGASVRVDKAASSIVAGTLGPPVVERLGLVQRIHEEILSALSGGGSKQTAKMQVDSIRAFFRWSDTSGYQLNPSAIESTYLHWADYLLHRIRIKKNLRETTAYVRARTVGAILDKALDRVAPLLFNTRMTSPRRRKHICGIQADKQKLADTYKFGHALLDIADCLHLDAIWCQSALKIDPPSASKIDPPQVAVFSSLSWS